MLSVKFLQPRRIVGGFRFKLFAVLWMIPFLGACSIQKFALKSLANTLGEASSVFASDEDPEFVREALPFALKTMEALLVKSPDNSGLLLSSCSGFTQYSYAFVETEAFLVEFDDLRRARQLEERALKLYLRARGYCLRALEIQHPGISDRLVLDPETAAMDFEDGEVELIYWTAASWGAAISLGQRDPDLAADLPVVRSLLLRGLELDEGFGGGVLHEAMISLEALPEAVGGSPERARRHFRRAVQLAAGRSAGAYVTLAEAVSVSQQNRREFRQLLDEALAIDVDAEPSRRLANLIAQSRAKELLARIDNYFLDGADELNEQEESP